MKTFFSSKSFIGGVLVLALGLVCAKFLLVGKPLPYKEMPGTYQCDDFGLPDPTYSRIQITPEMRVVGLSSDKQFDVGRLAPKDVGAELEYSMAVVHFSSFNLDPFTPPRFVVYGKSLSIKAKKPDQEFTVSCHKL